MIKRHSFLNYPLKGDDYFQNCHLKEDISPKLPYITAKIRLFCRCIVKYRRKALIHNKRSLAQPLRIDTVKTVPIVSGLLG